MILIALTCESPPHRRDSLRCIPPRQCRGDLRRPGRQEVPRGRRLRRLRAVGAGREIHDLLPTRHLALPVRPTSLRSGLRRLDVRRSLREPGELLGGDRTGRVQDPRGVGHHGHGVAPLRPVLRFRSGYSVPHRALRAPPTAQTSLLPHQRRRPLRPHVSPRYARLLSAAGLRGEGLARDHRPAVVLCLPAARR